jgi:hypothetical protein
LRLIRGSPGVSSPHRRLNAEHFLKAGRIACVGPCDGTTTSPGEGNRPVTLNRE